MQTKSAIPDIAINPNQMRDIRGDMESPPTNKFITVGAESISAR